MCENVVPTYTLRPVSEKRTLPTQAGTNNHLMFGETVVHRLLSALFPQQEASVTFLAHIHYATIFYYWLQLEKQRERRNDVSGSWMRFLRGAT